MSIDIDQCVFVGDRDQDSVVLSLANEECRLDSKKYPVHHEWSVYHRLGPGRIRFDSHKFNC